jgi:predicted NBD/HSP70 family sugar kinase
MHNEPYGGKRMGETVIYAIDIGDANMRGGVYIDGVTRVITTVDTPKEDRSKGGSERLLRRVRSVIAEIAAVSPPMQALAVSASGIMTLNPHPDARPYGPFKNQELFVVAPNVDGLKYTPLIRLLEDLGYDVPVHVENDVNASLESDATHQNVIGISLGAGLGAAAKKNGEVIHVGNTWSCFEIGHGMRWRMPEELSFACHCGSFGCLEAAIGGWAMTQRYKIEPQNASPEIYKRMRDDVIEVLPQAIASVVRKTQIPEVVMTGRGSVGYSRDPNFLHALTARTRTIENTDAITIELCEFGDEAELHGTALALLRHGVLQPARKYSSHTPP